MEALNDNDTWTRISLAALRVLTQIDQLKDYATGEQQETNRKNEQASDPAQHEARDEILGDRKLVV